MPDLFANASSGTGAGLTLRVEGLVAATACAIAPDHLLAGRAIGCRTSTASFLGSGGLCKGEAGNPVAFSLANFRGHPMPFNCMFAADFYQQGSLRRIDHQMYWIVV
jgi:hypothetical protein